MAGESMDPVGAAARSWWLVLLATVVGAAAVAGVVALRPVHWTSTAAVAYAQGDPSAALLGSAAAPQGDAVRVLNTQLQVAVGDAVLTAAATSVGADPTAMSDLLTVDLEPDSNVIRLSGTAETAAAAQRVTTAVVEAYVANDQQAGHDQLIARVDAVGVTIDSLNSRLDAYPPTAMQDPRRAAFAGQIAELAQQQEQLRAAAAVYPGHVSLLSAANLPLRPSSPDPRSAGAAGAGLGLVLGLLLAVVRAPRRRPAPGALYSTVAPQARRARLRGAAGTGGAGRAAQLTDTRAS